MPDEAIKEAEAGNLQPVYLVLGEETFLTELVARAVRAAAMKDGIPGLNEDRFTAGEDRDRDSAERIVGAAKVMPMMAKRRLVMVRALERWEGRDDAQGGSDEGGKSSKEKARPLDELAEYLNDPVDSTVLLLVASKLHGQRKIVTIAKKKGFLVACDPIPKRDLSKWVEARAKRLGHTIDREAAFELAELTGPDLGSVADALERLSLYVGPSGHIDERALADAITRVRPSTSWDLVDAVAQRRLGAALTILGRVDVDSELPLLGSIAWSVRQLVKFDGYVREGLRPDEAGQRAGMPPFKVDGARAQLRKLAPGTLSRWMRALADADRALKGSRRSGRVVMETLLIDMCR
jgi:DNA polymerase III subunit delta